MTLITNLEYLPNEVILGVFSFLEPDDLVRGGQVNKQWQEISKDNCLWHSIYNQYFSWLVVPADSNIKEFLDKSFVNKTIVKSRNQILKSLTTFVKKVQLNQLGIFSCKFPLNPEFSFCAKIAAIEKDSTNEFDFCNPDLSKECVFIKKLDGIQDYIGFETNINSGKKNILLKGVHIKLPESSDMSLFNAALDIVEKRLDELEETSE